LRLHDASAGLLHPQDGDAEVVVVRESYMQQIFESFILIHVPPGEFGERVGGGSCRSAAKVFGSVDRGAMVIRADGAT
jgi:hypothetical protein